jgi:cullin-4
MQSRLQEENERCILYLEANTRKPLIVATQKQLPQLHTYVIIEKVFIYF